MKNKSICGFLQVPEGVWFGMLIKIINLVTYSSFLLLVCWFFFLFFLFLFFLLLLLASHFTIRLWGRLGCNESPASGKRDTWQWSEWSQGLSGLLLTRLMVLRLLRSSDPRPAADLTWESCRKRRHSVACAWQGRWVRGLYACSRPLGGGLSL